jgi:hypothetical protein
MDYAMNQSLICTQGTHLSYLNFPPLALDTSSARLSVRASSRHWRLQYTEATICKQGLTYSLEFVAKDLPLVGSATGPDGCREWTRFGWTNAKYEVFECECAEA